MTPPTEVDLSSFIPENLPQYGQGRPMVSELSHFQKPAALFRYFWAAHKVKENDWKTAIDAACGCGYGSWVLAEYGGAEQVVGVDEDKGAIGLARACWERPGGTFDLKSILDPDDEDVTPVDVVVSLETIEHIAEPRKFLERFRRWSPNLIATVPDQDVTPFDQLKFPFHHRHYQQEEFRELLLEFYDEVEVFPGVEEWTKLEMADDWMEKRLRPGTRIELLAKLQANVRAVARSAT